MYEETIIPYLRKIESDLNEWLVPMFGEDLHFCYDIDQIPALSERRKKTYENVTSAVREGIITRNEARERLGLSPMSGGDELYISANLFPLGSEPLPPPNNDEDAKDYELDDDFDDDEEYDEEDLKTYDWDSLTEKAIADIDLRPTKSMQQAATQALEWRKEYNRGGTLVGVTRANQLKNREPLSPNTVKRMFSFFSRHEVDKQAEGFRQGEDGYPSAGRVAWGLWGGDAGFSWSRRKVAEINRELEKEFEFDEHVEIKEEKAEVSKRVEGILKDKVKDHNDKVGNVASKRTTLGVLKQVFNRGVGATTQTHHQYDQVLAIQINGL